MAAAALMWIVSLAAPAYWVWRTRGLLRLDLEVGSGGDGSTVFIDLVKTAESDVWICAAGDESVYALPSVVGAVAAALEARPGLQLFCLFDARVRTLFTRVFAAHPRVHIEYERPWRDVRFEIADGGIRGVVRCGRDWRRYDCARVPEALRQAALGRHLDGVRGAFRARGYRPSPEVSG